MRLLQLRSGKIAIYIAGQGDIAISGLYNDSQQLVVEFGAAVGAITRLVGRTADVVPIIVVYLIAMRN